MAEHALWLEKNIDFILTDHFRSPKNKQELIGALLNVITLGTLIQEATARLTNSILSVCVSLVALKQR